MPNHQTCFDRATLAEYLSEHLSESEESLIRQHLDDCSHCQQQVEEVAADETLWESLRVHAALSTEDTADDETDQRRQTLIEFLAPTDDPRMLGRLGTYEVCGFIGQGSTGIVLKAFEPSLNRYVAIKVLSPVYSSNGAARKRFEREGRAVAAVVHENIVPIHAVDQFRGLPYIVMQYVPGLSLLQRLEKDGPLETDEVARIGLQVAKGLAAAHKVGIVHRDVKPANVILENTIERALVTDFGLAQVADDASMTRSGTIAGTPQYMSPEQARGESIDPRSDLFSVGSLMYAACTARPPFRAETVIGVIHRVCNADPRPIREVNPKIDQWMCDFVDRLIAKEPQERFQTADEVASLLSQELAHLQNPTLVKQPDRGWQRPTRDNTDPIAPATWPKTRSKTRVIPWLVGCAALILVGTFFTEMGQGVVALFAPFNRAPIGAAPDEEGEVVDTENANGAAITWTKFENEWSTEATVTYDQKWEKSFEVSDQGTLTLAIDQADVLVRPADSDNKVTVTMMRRVEASSLGAAKAVLEGQSPKVTEDGDTFEFVCESENKEAVDAIERAVCRVAIPAKYNASVKLKSGDITIGDLDGDVTAATGFGAIRVGRVGGDLRVSGRGGCIDLTAGCEGGADVEGINADVYAANIGESSQLRLSGGNVCLGECEGEVYAQTSGGDISVQNILGKVSGFALDGSVLVRLDKSPESDCRFGTTRGTLEMRVGEQVAATIRTTQ
ncbi:MAG: protein kinase, partial [Planctomycetota bacterium]